MKKLFIIFIPIVGICVIFFSLGLFIFDKYYKISDVSTDNRIEVSQMDGIKNNISSYVRDSIVYLNADGKEEAIFKSGYADKNNECEQRVFECEKSNKNKDCSYIKSDVKVIIGTENGPKEIDDYSFCNVLFEFPLQSRISINKKFIHILVARYETAGNYVYDINSKEIHEITGQTDCGLSRARWLDDGNLFLFGEGGICGGGAYISLDPNKPWDMIKICDGSVLIDSENFPKE